MTLTIELTPDEKSELEAEATALGLELPEFARLRLLDGGRSRKFGTPEEESADEAEWEARFAATGDLLERLAAEADEERARGRTVPLKTLFEKHG